MKALRFTFIFFILFLQQTLSANPIICEGTYDRHLQGITAHDGFIYWSWTTSIVKTDMNGKILKSTPVNPKLHIGDLCCAYGKIYAVVNKGRFDIPDGKSADNKIFVYDFDLNFKKQYNVQDQIYGAGAISFAHDKFYVGGGLPKGADIEKFAHVYVYDNNFNLIKVSPLPARDTLYGIQTIAFDGEKFYMGCYTNKPEQKYAYTKIVNANLDYKGNLPIFTAVGIEILGKDKDGANLWLIATNNNPTKAKHGNDAYVEIYKEIAADKLELYNKKSD